MQKYFASIFSDYKGSHEIHHQQCELITLNYNLLGNFVTLTDAEKYASSLLPKIHPCPICHKHGYNKWWQIIYIKNSTNLEGDLTTFYPIGEILRHCIAPLQGFWKFDWLISMGSTHRYDMTPLQGYKLPEPSFEAICSELYWRLPTRRHLD